MQSDVMIRLTPTMMCDFCDRCSVFRLLQDAKHTTGKEIFEGEYWCDVCIDHWKHLQNAEYYIEKAKELDSSFGKELETYLGNMLYD